MSMWSRNADVFYVRGFGDYLNATDVLHFSLLINLLPLFFNLILSTEFNVDYHGNSRDFEAFRSALI